MNASFNQGAFERSLIELNASSIQEAIPPVSDSVVRIVANMPIDEQIATIRRVMNTPAWDEMCDVEWNRIDAALVAMLTDLECSEIDAATIAEYEADRRAYQANVL